VEEEYIDALTQAEDCIDEAVTIAQNQNQNFNTDERENNRKEDIDALLKKANTLVSQNIPSNLNNNELLSKRVKEDAIKLLNRIEAKAIPFSIITALPDIGHLSEELQNTIDKAKDEWNLIPTHPGIITTTSYVGPMNLPSSDDYSTATDDKNNNETRAENLNGINSL